MLLERFQRPVRGVRVVDKGALDEEISNCVQIIPLRQLTRKDVDRLLEQLSPGTDLLVTSALSQRERQAFEEVGFSERESLHLLRHDLQSIPEAEPVEGLQLRAGRRSDINDVLAIDKLSFDDFWVLDRDGIQAARKATPTNRYMIATINSSVVGYAVTGRSVRSSFLQRLGVHPSARRSGVGSQLVLDSLKWAQSEAANTMLVNTQAGNDRAVRLYEKLGFSLLGEKLKVLERATNPIVATG